MAIQTINIGTIANDGTGDDLREAFIKVNNNFSELASRDSENTTAANLGSAGEGVFAQISSQELQFKKIRAGTAVTLVSDPNSITINSTATGLPSLQVFADNNNITLNREGNTLTLNGGGNTTTNLVGSTITISSVTSLQTDTSPKLTSDLNAQNNNILNVANMLGLVHSVDIRELDGIQKYLNEFDAGLAIQTSFSSMLEVLADQVDIDYDDGSKTFTASNRVTLDGGALPTA